MKVRKVRKVRLFVTNFFLDKWTLVNGGKIGKKGTIVRANKKGESALTGPPQIC